MAKNLGGRPTKQTPELVSKLEDIFKNGANIDEACSYAGISRETYYQWLKQSDDFLTKMASAQYYPILVAKNVVISDIVRNKSIDSAKWYLERKARNEFSQRRELTGKDGESLPTPILAIDTKVKDVPTDNSNQED